MVPLSSTALARVAMFLGVFASSSRGAAWQRSCITLTGKINLNGAGYISAPLPVPAGVSNPNFFTVADDESSAGTFTFNDCGDGIPVEISYVVSSLLDHPLECYIF